MDKPIPVTEPLPKFAAAAEAARLVQGLGENFAIVRNPSYLFSPFEVYPLAPKPHTLPGELLAVVCDMDGTTTTTEPLCLHALEYMLRRATDRPDAGDWPGLDHERDHPNVIGNSTTKHIEYLIATYGEAIQREAYLAALIEGALWTIAVGRDEGRRDEALHTLRQLGLGALLEDAATRALLEDEDASLAKIGAHARKAAAALPEWTIETREAIVRGAIEIYYARYHQILQGIARGEGEELAGRILGTEGDHLIAPMPGVALFLCVLRGLLSAAEAEALLVLQAPASSPAQRAAFMRAVAKFIAQPARVAIVTSSIRYEAEIVLGECFAVVRAQVAAWPLPGERIQALHAALKSPQVYYDAIITASDSSEIRLKPHRDLYSIALHRIGLAPEQFDRVMGLEDSESGTIALRAAGVGLCVAVPFAQTMGHALEAAYKINAGGLPQLMFEDGFLIAP